MSRLALSCVMRLSYLIDWRLCVILLLIWAMCFFTAQWSKRENTHNTHAHTPNFSDDSSVFRLLQVDTMEILHQWASFKGGGCINMEWCQKSHRQHQFFKPLVNNTLLEQSGHALSLQFPVLLWAVLCVCELASRWPLQMDAAVLVEITFLYSRPCTAP